MARLIDPPAHFTHNPTGVPPVPPEAHQRANFSQRKFTVAAFLKEPLITGDDSDQEASIQFFLAQFVDHALEGSGFWTWGHSVVMARCDVCHEWCECVDAVWSFREEDNGL